MPAPLPSLSLPGYIPRSNVDPSRRYRVLVGSAILIGLLTVLYTALTGDLFLPARDALAAGRVAEAILRPSILWVIMGLTMLTIRTLLWFHSVSYTHLTLPTNREV